MNTPKRKLFLDEPSINHKVIVGINGYSFELVQK